MYKAVFDIGKSYEEEYKTDKELKAGLKKFYIENKNNDYPFDVVIYDEKGEDISESQFIEEMISEILEENKNVV